MKRKLSLFVAAAITMGVVSSCNAQTKAPTPVEEIKTPTSSTPAATGGKLTENQKTFSIVFPQWADTVTEGNTAQKAIEDKTNVKLNIKWIPGNDYGTKFDLMMASGEYTDLLAEGSMTAAKQFTYGTKEKILIPLNSYIEKYADGAFAKALKTNDNYRAALTGEDGNIYGIAGAAGAYHSQAFYKYWINTEWVKAVNKELPSTLDEFVEILKAFKENDMNSNGKKDEVPLTGSTKNWGTDLQYFLLNSFIDTDASNFLQVKNGKVELIANKNEFKAGITYIQNMYKQGLIDPSAFTQSTDQMYQLINADPTMTGCFAAGHLAMGVDINNEALSKAYTALAPLEGPDGVRSCYFHSNEIDNGNWSYTRLSITDRCDDPDLAYRFIDYLVSDEGTFLSFGEEGKWWNRATSGQIGLDGRPALYSLVIPADANAAGKKAGEFFNMFPNVNFNWHSGQAALSDDLYDTANYEYRLVQETKKYEPFAPKEILPYNTMRLSNADIATLADIKTALVEYIQQNIVLFIIGEKNLGSDWDKYVSELEGLKAGTYVEIYQRNYDKWLSNHK